MSNNRKRKAIKRMWAHRRATGFINMWRIWRRKKNKHVSMTKSVANYVERFAYDTLPKNLQDVFGATRGVPYSEMQIDTSEAQFLALLIHITKSKHVLEIGTFQGWSTAVMAQALHQTNTDSAIAWSLTTLELRKEQALDSQRLWDKYLDIDIRKNIKLITGDAQKILVNNHESDLEANKLFDLVFIDADKAQYRTYLELVLPKVSVGGLIVFDNALNAGLVATNAKDRITLALKELNSYVQEPNSLYEPYFIPGWDGVMILRKMI